MMFGIGKKSSFNSSMTTMYLFLFILVVNQFLTIHSFRLMSNDVDQDDARRAIDRRFTFDNFAVPDASSSPDDDVQFLMKRTPQRRFCCMHPLSGRKRSVRDLAKKKQLKRFIALEQNIKC